MQRLRGRGNRAFNPIYDMERFVYMSLLLRDMLTCFCNRTSNQEHELALLKTYNATPEPKLVVAMGLAPAMGIFEKLMQAAAV